MTTVENRGARPVWQAGILAFCTSASILVMEVLAGRLLAPYVGVTLETTSAIIGMPPIMQAIEFATPLLQNSRFMSLRRFQGSFFSIAVAVRSDSREATRTKVTMNRIEA